ncbi:MAG: preprotein translocase subunit SecG [Phycisphaerae bacterium]|nr:preprotein translocase subunit SecG [Phycisphaerae bacterium]
MTVLPMLAVNFFMSFVAVVFVICAVVLMLLILIQKGRGGGLGAAFGGGLASGILGSKTGDFLTWVTIALVGVFLTLAVVMAKYYKPSISDFGANQLQSTQQEEPAPASPDASQGGGPQNPKQSSAPDQAGSENADVNLLGE